MAIPGCAAISRISCGGWRMCLPSSAQSSAIIRRRRSASGSFQSATYFSANVVASVTSSIVWFIAVNGPGARAARRLPLV